MAFVCVCLHWQVMRVLDMALSFCVPTLTVERCIGYGSIPVCAFIDGSGVLDMALSFTAVFKLSPMLFNFGGIWAESVSKA